MLTDIRIHVHTDGRTDRASYRDARTHLKMTTNTINEEKGSYFWQYSSISLTSRFPADTFASKVAAVQDEYADSSIGNVTGSNGVNVFLGT